MLVVVLQVFVVVVVFLFVIVQTVGMLLLRHVHGLVLVGIRWLDEQLRPIDRLELDSVRHEDFTVLLMAGESIGEQRLSDCSGGVRRTQG